MKKDVFQTEINKIKNQRIKDSTELLLEMIPDYFYEIPASSSGKYHPLFSLGKGGLVRHVKVAMRILEELFNDSAFGTYDDDTKDLMRMALLLHDGFKSGYENSGHTCSEHPVLMSDFILQTQEQLFITPEEAEFVARIIRTHMGPWNTDKSGKEIMPVPKTREEIMIHLCDYIASRNFLNVYFKDDEIADSAERRKTYEKKQDH